MVNPVRNLKPTSLENFSNGVKALLVLSDGTVFEGKNFGAEGETIGEVVFNTSMTGYQEILTDPSYKGQIVTMTYTQIGNYGVNSEDIESRGGPEVEGFIVKEYLPFPSNWRAEKFEFGLEKFIRGLFKRIQNCLYRRNRYKGTYKALEGPRLTDGNNLNKGSKP